MFACQRSRLRLLALGLFSITISNASAFDTGPHFDMTRDAMQSEGFGDVSIKVAQVANWFDDLYEQDTNNAYSGHQTWFGSVSGFVGNLLTLFRKENWPSHIVRSAEKLHFDSSNPMDSTPQAEAEWQRFARATKFVLKNRVAAGDIEGILVVMGMTLHSVQDFYTHSNWVEPQGVRQTNGFSGPGWASRRSYGSHPTWFDVPAAERAKVDVYSRKQGDPEATHGSWDTPNSGPGKNGMNKDSAGRRFYREAYVTALIASRQWIQAMRTWIGNESVWNSVKNFANKHGGELDHDQKGAFELSWLVGHWNGNEGVKGGKPEIIKAGISYFEGMGKTTFRKKWEELLPGVQMPNPPAEDTPVPSSRGIVQNSQFIVSLVDRLKQIDDIDGGDVPLITENDADFYSKAMIYNQEFKSALIDGKNSFNFPSPYAPLIFIKQVPAVRNVSVPVTRLEIRLRTGNVDGAGTDMDLHLLLTNGKRLKFPYGDFDDFERGRNDWYNFPVPNGITVSQLAGMRLLKGGGGSNHEWNLAGMEVRVNGTVALLNENINRWFRARDEVWPIPGVTLPPAGSPDVPIYYELWDSDWGLTFGDDQADICPAKGSQTLRLLFNPLTRQFQGDLNGTNGALVRGGGDDDRAEMNLRFEVLAVTPPPGRLPDGLRNPGLAPIQISPTPQPPSSGSPTGGVRPTPSPRPRPIPVKPPIANPAKPPAKRH